MHRAGLGSVVALASLLAAPAARAYHAGDVFDKAAGAGGGGGVFYTGAPRERAWDCTACHQGAAGTIRIDLSAMPSALLDGASYAPGQTYQLTAKLRGEHLGLGSPQANYNGFAIAAADG